VPGFGQQSTIGFIGAEAVRGTLAVASGTFASAYGLAQHLVCCTAYALSQQVVDMCELVFISTPDDALGQGASGLTWRGGQVGGALLRCHVSGRVCRADGAGCVLPGALHPFQAVASLDTGGRICWGHRLALKLMALCRRL
jgi:hypothetical protein